MFLLDFFFFFSSHCRSWCLVMHFKVRLRQCDEMICIYTANESSSKVAIWENICRLIVNSRRLSDPPFFFFFFLFLCYSSSKEKTMGTIEALHARLCFLSSLVCSSLHLSSLMRKGRSQVLFHLILTSPNSIVNFFISYCVTINKLCQILYSKQ